MTLTLIHDRWGGTHIVKRMADDLPALYGDKLNDLLGGRTVRLRDTIHVMIAKE
jgi:hypothetical protein